MAMEKITAAMVILIQRDRLLGEIMLQLPRQLDDQQSAALGLSWQKDQLVLMINPYRIDELRQDELVNLLAHEALHLVWQHPLRYADYVHPQLAQVATDIAVNQYLPEPPAGTATLSQVEKALQTKLPVQADSQDYLTILERTDAKQQERLRRQGIKLAGHQSGAAPADSHRGWRSTGKRPGNQLVRQGKLIRLLKRAWQQTPQRNRGLLPGDVVAQLKQVIEPRQVSWQKLLRRQVGLIAQGQQESHARFNRRQPLRMDLAGSVTHLVPEINIFVDHSGSVSDEELGAALMTIAKLTRQAQLTTNVYAFDAQVDPTSKQVLTPGQAVKLVRHGGGGTRFQSVFDYLLANHVSRSTSLTIIVTDGWGEKQLRTHHYRNVCWLLMTTKEELSVKQPVGQVLEMGMKK